MKSIVQLTEIEQDCVSLLNILSKIPHENMKRTDKIHDQRFGKFSLIDSKRYVSMFKKGRCRCGYVAILAQDRALYFSNNIVDVSLSLQKINHQNDMAELVDKLIADIRIILKKAKTISKLIIFGYCFSACLVPLIIKRFQAYKCKGYLFSPLYQIEEQSLQTHSIKDSLFLKNQQRKKRSHRQINIKIHPIIKLHQRLNGNINDWKTYQQLLSISKGEDFVHLNQAIDFAGIRITKNRFEILYNPYEKTYCNKIPVSVFLEVLYAMNSCKNNYPEINFSLDPHEKDDKIKVKNIWPDISEGKLILARTETDKIMFEADWTMKQLIFGVATNHKNQLVQRQIPQDLQKLGFKNWLNNPCGGQFTHINFTFHIKQVYYNLVEQKNLTQLKIDTKFEIRAKEIEIVDEVQVEIHDEKHVCFEIVRFINKHMQLFQKHYPIFKQLENIAKMKLACEYLFRKQFRPNLDIISTQVDKCRYPTRIDQIPQINFTKQILRPTKIINHTVNGGINLHVDELIIFNQRLNKQTELQPNSSIFQMESKQLYSETKSLYLDKFIKFQCQICKVDLPYDINRHNLLNLCIQHSNQYCFCCKQPILSKSSKIHFKKTYHYDCFRCIHCGIFIDTNLENEKFEYEGLCHNSCQLAMLLELEKIQQIKIQLKSALTNDTS